MTWNLTQDMKIILSTSRVFIDLEQYLKAQLLWLVQSAVASSAHQAGLALGVMGSQVGCHWTKYTVMLRWWGDCTKHDR